MKRKHTQTKTALSWFFGIANLVGQGVEVQTFSKFFNDTRSFDDQFLEWLSYLRQHKALYAYLTKGFTGEELKHSDMIIVSIHNVLEIREFANLLADYSEKFRDARDRGEPLYFWHELKMPVLMTIGSKVDTDDSTIHLNPGEWYGDAVNGLDITRIRRCELPECRKLFWANRTDKMACEKKCSLIAAQRRNKENERKREMERKQNGDL